ncbi:adenylate/guanylate cyclase domain-containing protein [Mesorhizobium sp. WSM4303]|uniref:adenylate/guanylate cyclase domain-containing protein n=1 Tax=unclassified Mesorhizobium TaxID=325217 RepID=UPI00115C4EEA|nr:MULTISPECIES: adenylate/guanylate cyclase domain-containing protein [unclassified Mesorhizobium]TRC93723.1 adenylate/guanylate cyclase domain-containing protein [Mesorhizobium sp. WSM4306]TRD08529.1 adenylate/guanylate cyclase domain-containing protein [Mesorhizobium sp. WSM4303]
MKRKMVALMAADIVGYSAMMERDEEQTAERLAGCQTLISEKVGLLDGRVFNTAGDAAFAEFPSAVNAVRSAFEIRTTLAGLQEPAIEPLRMRFGLHIADVMVQGDDLIGDGVNLAARIQAASEPDSIYVSGALFDHVRRSSAFIFDDIGERAFKNISEPVHLYRVRGEIGTYRLQSAPTQLLVTKERRPSSVAVLPFRVSGDYEDQRYLADGLTEELIVNLGRYRRLSVSSRSASFSMADSHPDPVRAGEVLGVRFVLEGQVRKIGERVSISLTLSETDQGAVVWSDKVHRSFDEILALLDETAATIAATVSGRMEDAAMVAARRKLPENMTAFDCLLRGLDHHRLGGVTDDNAHQSVGWFTKAIDADPNYAAAYAWRVCAASWLSDFDFEQGRRDIRRALELDSCDAEANRIMGFVELMDGNFDEALAHVRKAMELNPTDAYIKARCAAVYNFLGEGEHSLSLLDEAEMLDPFLPVWCVEERGVALYSLGRHAEAIESFGKLTFQTIRSRLYRAAALVALNRADDASRMVREAVGGKPDLTASDFTSREYYRDPRKVRELGRLLREAGLPP